MIGHSLTHSNRSDPPHSPHSYRPSNARGCSGLFFLPPSLRGSIGLLAQPSHRHVASASASLHSPTSDTSGHAHSPETYTHLSPPITTHPPLAHAPQSKAHGPQTGPPSPYRVQPPMSDPLWPLFAGRATRRWGRGVDVRSVPSTPLRRVEAPKPRRGACVASGGGEGAPPQRAGRRGSRTSRSHAPPPERFRDDDNQHENVACESLRH